MTHHHLILFAARAGRIQRQTGASLLIVLIFMLVLSVLATFGVRNVRMLERQAMSEQEYQLARQAAEAALADAVLDIEGSFPNASCTRAPAIMSGQGSLNEAAFGTDCPRGLCSLSDPAQYQVDWATASSDTPGAPWWPASKGGMWGNNANANGTPNFDCGSGTGGVPLGSYTNTPAFPRVVRQPEYLVEWLNIGPKYKCPQSTPSGAASPSAAPIYSAANETTALGSGGSGSATAPDCYLLRITSRGFGTVRTNAETDIPNPRVEVVLQGYVYRYKPQ